MILPTQMARMVRLRGRLAVALLVSLTMATAGCGGDEEAPEAPKAKAGKGKKKGKKKKKKKKGKVQEYAKVPEALRHKFIDRDFQNDPSGDTNRDPFRSFLLGAPLGEGDEGASGDLTQICPPERTIASKYPIRSLNLIGIVLRGTRSYSLFRDSSRFGHIVKRGDCLGKEKAVVSEIGVGYVSLEVSQDSPQSAGTGPAQVRTIALYPDELPVDVTAPTEGAGDDGEGAAGAP